MRMLLKFSLDVEAANLAIADGSIGKIFAGLFDKCRPEAAFFMTDGGRRTGHLYFDMNAPEEIPQLAEPLFQGMNATVDFIPVMTAPELEKGLAAWAGGR